MSPDREAQLASLKRQAKASEAASAALDTVEGLTLRERRDVLAALAAHTAMRCLLSSPEVEAMGLDDSSGELPPDVEDDDTA